jgi:hypothetical protein
MQPGFTLGFTAIYRASLGMTREETEIDRQRARFVNTNIADTTSR